MLKNNLVVISFLKKPIAELRSTFLFFWDVFRFHRKQTKTNESHKALENTTANKSFRYFQNKSNR